MNRLSPLAFSALLLLSGCAAPDTRVERPCFHLNGRMVEVELTAVYPR